MQTYSRRSKTHAGLVWFGLLLGVVGALLAAGGLYLVTLGGSWYYLIAGAGTLLSGVWISQDRLKGVGLYLAVFGFTVLWTLWESGLNVWGWVPRTLAPAGLAFLALFLVPLFRKTAPSASVKKASLLGGSALVLALLAMVISLLFPHGMVYNKDVAITPGEVSATTAAAGDEWRDYGRTGEQTRYAPFDQINRSNVDKLEVLWTARHGDIATYGNENQNTPLYVDGSLYHCSPSDIVTALDGATGKIKWQFDPKAKAPFWHRCRAVSYYDPGPGDSCGPRIVLATIDSRLLAVRTKDGQLCETFGDKGTVSLMTGIGDSPAGLYMQTSGTMIAGNKIIMGGWVGDNVMVGEASGVIRAFDAATGELAWAWDLGNPAITKLPPAGQTYTRGTPNVWTTMSYDLKLGLVYLPTGNATPDYVVEHRRPFDNEYASAVVALDLNTGKEKWKFQTTHLDQWDYDVPAPPSLVDVPGKNGEKIPALIQITKRGQIFMLDRRTGAPIAEVEERPVPQGHTEGQYYAKTQPYSVGMPAIGAEPLREDRTWGMTPLDHLYCRIKFKSHIYHGDFTPPDVKPYLFSPGNNGGFNWGGASVDQSRNLLIVNDIRMPISAHFISRAEADALPDVDAHGTYSKMIGTRFGMYLVNFLSPMEVPCMQGPYGTMTAIDLVSRKIVWQVPVGTTKEVGPFGLRMGVPFNVGMPTLGGTVATKGGVVFISGTQDYYLRAYDVETGKELWKGALPTGGEATPLTYIDKASGRQIVLVNASGAPHNPRDRGDYLIAYALPAAAK
ncbi:membrane-bound PQQ-dependent dehydrogenase, glucose/quinate/shikimate family [Variovorax rhizosphaerae]|uniref:Membrane-bound PQQ-dependent dehydrogenase, glucose/quinate/shikimate family n=1 Tax=Variovorax rhizosphaerae TaxID=1836200 RepID=A0ABU8WNE7_9BURK